MPRMTQAEYRAWLAEHDHITEHGKSFAGEKMDAAISERELHNDILEYCRARGWVVFHGSMAHKTRRQIGEPDFLIFPGCGKILLVECKTKTGKLTPEQAGLKLQLAKLGIEVHIVRSLAEFEQLTKGLK